MLVALGLEPPPRVDTDVRHLRLSLCTHEGIEIKCELPPRVGTDVQHDDCTKPPPCVGAGVRRESIGKRPPHACADVRLEHWQKFDMSLSRPHALAWMSGQSLKHGADWCVLHLAVSRPRVLTRKSGI